MQGQTEVSGQGAVQNQSFVLFVRADCGFRKFFLDAAS